MNTRACKQYTAVICFGYSVLLIALAHKRSMHIYLLDKSENYFFGAVNSGPYSPMGFVSGLHLSLSLPLSLSLSFSFSSTAPRLVIKYELKILPIKAPVAIAFLHLHPPSLSTRSFSSFSLSLSISLSCSFLSRPSLFFYSLCISPPALDLSLYLSASTPLYSPLSLSIPSSLYHYCFLFSVCLSLFVCVFPSLYFSL